jgi:hypothetical protein
MSAIDPLSVIIGIIIGVITAAMGNVIHGISKIKPLRSRNYNGDFILKRFDVEKIEKGIPLMDTLICQFELEIIGSWQV